MCRGGPVGGCSSPGAIGKHLTCDLRTYGQERGAARRLDEVGHAGVLRAWPSCWPHTCLLAPRWNLSVGVPQGLGWHTTLPSSCSTSGTSPGPAPWGAWVSSVQRFESHVAGGLWDRSVQSGPCCQSPYSPRCPGRAHLIPRGPDLGLPQTPCACQEAPAVALLRADQTEVAGDPAP